MKFNISIDIYNSEYISFNYFNLNQNFDFVFFGDILIKNPINSSSGFSFLDITLNFIFYNLTFFLNTNKVSLIEIDIKFPSQLIFTFPKQEDLKYLKDFYYIHLGTTYIFADSIKFIFQNETITISELIEQKKVIKDNLLFFFTEDENSYIFGFKPINNLLQKNQNYNYALSKPFLSHPFGYPKDTQVTINNYNQPFTILDSILVQNQKNLFDPFYLVQNNNNQFLVKESEVKNV